MAEELKIMQKVFDMMQYGYGALAQYPKSENRRSERAQRYGAGSGAGGIYPRSSQQF